MKNEATGLLRTNCLVLQEPIGKFCLLTHYLQSPVRQTHSKNCSLVNCERCWLLITKRGYLRGRESRGIKCGVWIAQQTVSPRDAPDIFLGFRVRRNAPAILFHCALAGVISGQSKIDVSIKEIEQKANVARAAFDILFSIENIRDSIAGRSPWHQLHEPTRPFRRDGVQFETRFLMHD